MGKTRERICRTCPAGVATGLPFTDLHKSDNRELLVPASSGEDRMNDLKVEAMKLAIAATGHDLSGDPPALVKMAVAIEAYLTGRVRFSIDEDGEIEYVVTADPEVTQ